ncbi:hypothetical protein A35E_00329 [secondary endosymbiont of Heteropsylla cubana]|uniref:Uncharacterized protein n=1 Tax=secondary endosymbiont of Heteropsylla cubana TaxID=134287 RepID=J3YT76_9ENTR|nr:hypothetical protein A35E_00329 [secondary endosymbiont of Heteropsylla cubana]
MLSITVDFPDSETPVMHVNNPNGRVKVISLKLLLVVPISFNIRLVLGGIRFFWYRNFAFSAKKLTGE